ncbi:MAG: hypothetical protein AB1598_13960 [Thermodesulfobacteriota bacterium]
MTFAKSMKFSSVILAAAINLSACAAPRVITPEISRESYEALKESQPDCKMQIGALEAARELPDPLTACPIVSDDLILDALYCYRSVWKHWENAYRVLDTELDAAQMGGGVK